MDGGRARALTGLAGALRAPLLSKQGYPVAEGQLAALAPLHGSAPHRSALQGARASLGLSVGAALPMARWQGFNGSRVKGSLHRPYGAVLERRKPKMK